ncbi:MAG: hypothetical protein OEL89_00645, partial [Candidatus Peregrinibacteria bacterium]|nr:hypothetical protein [Candidatus Peregrinibacteria bacterium]
MITLDSIDSSLHSIEIKNAAGQALALDGSGFLTANVNGSVSITDGGGSITVDGTVAATQSGTWNIGSVASITGDVNIADGGNSITVDAVNLDIRDLAFATDSVTAYQGGSWSVAATQSGSWAVTTNAGGFASWKVSVASVDTTVGGSELIATPLTGRLSMLIQNLGSNDVYLKEATGVTSANGMKLPKGSSFAADLDDAANI